MFAILLESNIYKEYVVMFYSRSDDLLWVCCGVYISLPILTTNSVHSSNNWCNLCECLDRVCSDIVCTLHVQFHALNLNRVCTCLHVYAVSRYVCKV